MTLPYRATRRFLPTFRTARLAPDHPATPQPCPSSPGTRTPTSAPTSAPTRARTKIRTGLIAALVAGILAATAAIAYAAIDPWPSYQPQRTCSPAAKRGTLELATWLQRTYPGSGSYGISRACGSGGTSEHKEGRAFDWRVDVNSPKERGYAADFIRRLRAVDSLGNPASLARRMGVMYVIWNDTIYSATRHYAPRAYLNAGCRSVATCSATLRHRNHVHISLTWAGARANTSWYGGHRDSSPTGPPVVDTRPDPGPRVNAHQMRVANFDAKPLLRLRATPGKTTVSKVALARGRTYKVTAYGVHRYGPGHQLISDAACVWDPASSSWRQKPRAASRARYGDPQLLVNGAAVLAHAKCRGGQHVYQARITPKRKGPVRVAVAGRAQGAPSLQVVVSKVAAPVRAVIPKAPAKSAPPVPAPVRNGYASVLRDDVHLSSSNEVTYSDEVLEAGQPYRVTVWGVRRLTDGVATDGQCLAIGGRWEPRGSLDLYSPGAFHGSLYLDGTRFAGAAPAEDPTGCLTHSHTMTYVPSVTGRLPMQLWDPTGPRDDSGSLEVRIERMSPVALPAAAAAETPRSSADWTRRYERLDVAASAADGVLTSSKFKVGQRVGIYVSGTTTVSAGRKADASCVQDGWVYRKSLGLPSGQDLLGLSVDGQLTDWDATDDESADCSRRHEYYAKVSITKNGPLRLAIADLDYRDNNGSLSVLLIRD